MTTVSATQINGVITPESYHTDAVGVDFNGASYCFIRPEDLASPDARVLASPTGRVQALQTSPFVFDTRVFSLHFNRMYAGASPETVPPEEVAMPVVRSHDGGVRWSQLNPSAGTYSWERLDSWLDRVEARGAIPIYTVFGSPTWASARPTEIGAYGPGSPGLSAEPASMAALGDFLAALVARYGSRIKHYEVWNEVNLSSFFSGTQPKLADMVATVYAATSGVPGRKIISPSITGWVTAAGGTAETYFLSMLNTTSTVNGMTIKSMSDYLGVHLYVGGNDHRQIPGICGRIRAAASAAGVASKEVWDTESNLISPDIANYIDPVAATLLRRRLAVIGACGIPVSCQYTFDHTTMGWKDRPEIGEARESLFRTLAGVTFDSAVLLFDGRVIFKKGDGVVTV